MFSAALVYSNEHSSDAESVQPPKGVAYISTGLKSSILVRSGRIGLNTGRIGEVRNIMNIL